MKGQVLWFDTTKGYGFIKKEDTNEDVFFHATNVLEERHLQQNDLVEFEIIPGKDKKKQAVKVTRITEKEEEEEKEGVKK